MCAMSSRDEIIQSDYCILLPPPLHVTLAKLDVATLPKNVVLCYAIQAVRQGLLITWYD